MNRKMTKKLAKLGQLECPICKNKEILVEHHIRGRKIKNCNHPSNLAYVCSNCHNKIHNGIVVLEGYFMTSSGLELFWHTYKEDSFTGENITPHIF